jgi:hypothetical protein
MNIAFLVLAAAVEPLHTDGLSSTPVVINEFMPVPVESSTEAEGEWIELYNRSDEYINLSGWRIQNQSGSVITVNTCLLPPDGYLVLGASGDPGRNGGYMPGQTYTGFSIASSGSLILLNPQGTTMEIVSYNWSWPISSGYSCERINPDWTGTLSSSWSSSMDTYGDGDYGTPGIMNSVFENSFASNTWAFIKAFVQ